MKVNHDPDDRLDYKWDWSTFLEEGELIDDATVVAGNLLVETPTVVNSGTAVVAWISGGTLGTTVDAVCHVTTSNGREVDRTIVLNVTST